MPDWGNNIYPVLLAGGTGTRLWPVSRELYPKQLVNFIGQDSLFQTTIKRLFPLLDKEKVRIVCGKEHYYEIARHMEGIGVPSDGKIIAEPVGRNTAPAILLAVLTILKKEQDAILCVFPADHVIKDIQKLKTAIKLAGMGYIVTFGIKPHYPETGYGYIEGARAVNGVALTIKRFVEKPDKETAETYIDAGNFFWNSGMFVFKASVILEEFNKSQSQLLNRMRAIVSGQDSVSKTAYEGLPNISIDYAIMESTDKGVVLPSDFGWSDIGSWKSLYDFLPKDENNNVINGDVIANDTTNCFIMGHERLIATNHLHNMVVVETPDSVFVSDIDDSRNVKAIVDQLKEKGRQEYHTHRTIHYPWGRSTLLEQKNDFKIDRLVLYPASVFESKRDAAAIINLFLMKGSVRVTTKKGSRLLQKGQSTAISEKGLVKIENRGEETAYITQVQIGNKA
ncbi:mannose-1-phosphate guanylyltransferase/mannose-6-phosphate isomerase [Thermodesulfobacteriota bacterium]